MKYKPNGGGDAFLDRKGRVWYAAREADLPANPDEYETIPPAYWHPKARGEWENEASWAIALDRDER